MYKWLASISLGLLFVTVNISLLDHGMFTWIGFLLIGFACFGTGVILARIYTKYGHK